MKDPDQILHAEIPGDKSGKVWKVTRRQVQNFIDEMREKYAIEGDISINIAAIEDLQKWLDEQ